MGTQASVQKLFLTSQQYWIDASRPTEAILWIESRPFPAVNLVWVFQKMWLTCYLDQRTGRGGVVVYKSTLIKTFLLTTVNITYVVKELILRWESRVSILCLGTKLVCHRWSRQRLSRQTANESLYVYLISIASRIWFSLMDCKCNRDWRPGLLV